MLVSRRPLHGDSLLTLNISNTNGKRELAQRRYAMEFDLSEIVSSTRHTDHEGIFVIDLFEAGGHISGRPTTLEAAKEKNPKSQRFLVSGVAGRLMVATSRIGYQDTAPYSVVPSTYTEGYEYDMLDCSSSWDDTAMLHSHTNRVTKLGGDVNSVTDFDVENVFRNVALSAPERS